MSDQEFALETDHKPLERIHPRASKLCGRMERWVYRALMDGILSEKDKYPRRFIAELEL